MSSGKLRKHLEQHSEGDVVVENFCLIGTPLPSLNAKRDANEFKPAWQQEVYDEQGRRRFHGAFTGGWSAGYYNSVGSKEGWTPSSFRSSRKDRQAGGSGATSSQNARAQTVEDFMDDEDKADLKQGRGALQYNDSLVQSSRSHPDPLLGALGGEASKVESQASTSFNPSEAGARILKSMGWEPGQGIGPLVSRAVRRQRQRLLGLVLDAAQSGADNQLVPPPDTPLPQASSGTSERRGLGWAAQDGKTGGTTLSVLLSKSRGQDKVANEKEARSGGFGIGALEHDSDGEDEVYTSNRTVSHGIPRSTMASISTTNGGNQFALSNDLPADVNNTWHDGLPMIVGFVIAQREQENEKWFSAPEIPLGWQPDPSRVWGPTSKEAGNLARPVALDAKTRSSMLGEARAPGPPPLISDYLSLKDRERLQRARAQEDAHDKALHAEDEIQIPKLDSDVARAALRGYLPFAEDMQKQARYKAYLESQIGDSRTASSSLAQSYRDAVARRQELNEFVQSAAIFKPMNVVMASRFETAKAPVLMGERPAGLHVPERKADVGEELVERDASGSDVNERLSTAQQYARQGQFGPRTTRTVKAWKPTKLLCKRFDVVPPYPDEADPSQEERDETSNLEHRVANRPEGVNNVNARWEESKRQLQQLAAGHGYEKQTIEPVGTEVSQPIDAIDKSDLSHVGFGDSFKDDFDEAGQVKPSIDVFKAIFEENFETLSDLERPNDGVKATSYDAPALQHDSSGNEPPRLTFIPRKRQTESSDVPTAKEESSERPDRKRTNKKKKNSKSRGMLTFDLDDHDDD